MAELPPQGTSLHDLVDRWFEAHNQIKQLNAEKKEWTDTKKELGKLILETMESQDIDKYTSDEGTIEMKKRVKKKTSVNKKKLKEIIEDADEGAFSYPLEASQVSEFVFQQFPVEEEFYLDAAKTDLP
jgi:polyribonucleotide nucleotidyltransferase